ncbi:MAG: U32 family peptidase [Treponema sp.]|jgi:putative protease|nr:U32 family peptidase [Treponema sp.]
MVAQSVELLAPAGSPEALDAAIGEGADAVYLGLKNFNARVRSVNFAYSQFEGALRSLHRMGRKLYVTVNTVFEQREADRVYQLLKYLASLGPDGIIVQDFGMGKMVRDHFPSLKLHASTQMNVASARGANLLSKQGFSRVVLARELSLREIGDIRNNTNIALEVFIHGALCVSASGLCLFSAYLGGKSANRGMCTQACRRRYSTASASGYYFSPADLQLIEAVPGLIDAGVRSFKIEGRMKSAEYVGTVVSAYRRVIDGLDGDREKSIQEGLAILRNDFARRKTAFYLYAEPHPQARPSAGESPERQEWLNPEQDGGAGIPLGTILKVKGLAQGSARSRGTGQGGANQDDEEAAGRRGLIPWGALMPGIGDSIRLHRADDSDRQSHKITFAEPEAPGAGASRNLWISIPQGFDVGDSVYLIRTKTISKRYSPVIPRNLESFRRLPGREKAPELNLPPVKKKESAGFPEGLYVAVSRIEDLYIIQSVRPIRVMLGYNRKIAAYLLGDKKPPLPFTPGEIILVLDPYFPQALDGLWAGEIPRLMALGYRQFVVNNLGHFSCFRNTGAPNPALIAGPYLYAFNRWAVSFIASLGTDALVSPPENNRQNLERTISPDRRPAVFLTIFAYPALFRIRADLSGVYDFGNFRDSRDEQFRLISSPDGSLVVPEKPFSIVDKIPFLKESGFGRFILDLSGPPLRKRDYKDIMAAVKNAAPLPNSGRFNWKDGFYSAEE